jgi:predicted metal-dependent hydrolase
MSTETPKQPNGLDEKFFERADAYINLANEHINTKVESRLVSASLMFASARFNAWISASGFENGEDLKARKKELLEYFTNQYTSMLEENLDNYADNYDLYMGISKEQAKK